MSDIAFKFCWQKNDPQAIRDAREFWTSLNSSLGRDSIEDRSAELCAAAYRDGAMVGVSTIMLSSYPRLGGRFAFYRTAVAPGFRRQNVAARLCAFSRDSLAQWSREKPEEKIKGFVISVQSDELFRERRHLPIISTHGLDFVFIGYGDAGKQMRVVWFSDAAID